MHKTSRGSSCLKEEKDLIRWCSRLGSWNLDKMVQEGVKDNWKDISDYEIIRYHIILKR